MKALSLDTQARYPNALSFQMHSRATCLPTVLRPSESMSFLHEATRREEEKQALEAGSQVAQELFNRPEDLSLEPEWQEELNTAGPTLRKPPLLPVPS